jgi:hypothetical protein
LDYLGSTCPKLLLEPQRSNLITYSEQFDNAAWTKSNSTVTANAAVAPDGTTTADKILDTTSTTGHSTFQSTVITNGATYTLSVFAKAAERTRVWVDIFGGTTAAVFDLTAGTVLAVSSGKTASITPYGNGWYRCAVTGAVADPFAYPNIGPTTGSTTNNQYTGDGTSGVLVWGAMLELGAYATSYVKTEAAAVTRLTDAASKTGITSLIGQTEGVLFADFVVNGQANNANILNSEKNTTQSFFMAVQTNGNFDAGLYISGSLTGRIVTTGGGLSVGQRIKVAYAYKSGSFALYINGVQRGVLSNTFTPVTTFDDIFLNDVTYFNYKENVSFNQVLLFKTRLTNAQLAELTTL